MRNTTSTRTLRAYQSLVAENTEKVIAARAPVWLGAGCSPRASVAYSFLLALEWFRDKLSPIFFRGIRKFQKPSLPHHLPLLLVHLPLVLCTTLALAQTPFAPPKPGPEVNELGKFVGEWSGVGEVKPGMMGGGGKATDSASCEWTSGGFAVLCRETASTPGMGEITDVGIVSYDPNAKNYIFYQVNNWGAIWVGRGTFNGDTWTWTSEDTLNGKTMQLRFTEKWKTPDSYEFKNEVGPTADSMMVMMDGKLTRVTDVEAATKPAPNNHAGDQQAIRRLNEDLLKAHQMGDVDALDRIEDVDFTVAGAFGEAPKRQHLDEVRHRGNYTSRPALTVENARIRFYGDAALLTEVEKYGSPVIEPGFETTSLWVRRGGDWKVVHLHYSSSTKKP